MKTGYVALGIGLALVFGSGLKPTAAYGQSVEPGAFDEAGNPIYLDEREVIIPLQPGTIPAGLIEAYFSNDRDFYTNRTPPRQFDYIFGGTAGYPENQIYRDGRAINAWYDEVLARQLFTGPLLRTPDLPNPFNESVRNLPLGQASTAPLPPQSRPSFPPVIEEVPSTRPSVAPPTQGPVPALW